jgi:hypothetical protein
MKSTWHTAWHGPDIVVYQDDKEVDRFTAADAQRVIFVHRGPGDTPGDLAFALVELPDEYILFPADTGFAGRVHFERVNFWEDKRCVYWAPEARAPLPGRLRRGLWLIGPSHPVYRRVPRNELEGVVERWALTGPQTWEQRKWERIAQSRPFGSSQPAAFDALSQQHKRRA